MPVSGPIFRAAVNRNCLCGFVGLVVAVYFGGGVNHTVAHTVIWRNYVV
jgi:hypothetical protein